jgi:filamentous hemagglutinin
VIRVRSRNFGVAAAAALLTFVAGASAQTATELPVPCVAGVCGANVAGFVTSGRGTATVTNNVLRVNQQTDRAIFNWASFNVGADGRVIFEQPGANSIALNRIFQGDPSRILGAIEANGQIFLINQNGFMFGPTARVRTAGLMVSSLNMTDRTFENGLLSPEILQERRAALESDGRVGVLDPRGDPVLGEDGNPLEVKITIAPGAKIQTVGKGGRVMLASRTVDNAGEIEAPDGQVILAAGEKVYLQASSDPALRGLLVEVDAGGEAWNRMTGSVSAPHGNVTMVGLAVNQHGRVSATTSVSANGSIRLLARDSVTVDFDAANNPSLTTTRGGRLELGAGSQTVVTPDLADAATAIDEQRQSPSSIELSGRQVFVRGANGGAAGAAVRANGGNIRIRALDDAASAEQHDPEARVRVEAGAVLDASGSDATASVTRNVVRVELRGNELRDAPLQRDGTLRGKEVFIDARVGTPLADVSGAIAGIGRRIDERTAAGGTITVDSSGDVVVAPGAMFDVSGGTLTYTGGAMQTTQLLTADGRAVDIGSASPNQLYVGLINPQSTVAYNRWGVSERVRGPYMGRYETGYTEGFSAGTLQFTGRALSLDGQFLGGVSPGVTQRDAARAPQGGRFIVGADLPAGASIPDYRAPSINFVARPVPVAIADDGSLPQRPLDLTPTFATAGGFTRIDLFSNGVVHVPESMMLALAPGSALRITAHRVEMQGSVTAAGGSVRLASAFTTGVDGAALPRAGVVVGDHSVLDVRGLWNNELSLLTPAFRDGGEIDLAVRAFDGELVLGDGARLLADGGASLSAAGTVTGGRGGRIGLRAGASGAAIDIGAGVVLGAHGVANARGGSFALEAPRVEIADGIDWSQAQRLDLSAGDTGFLTIGDALFSASGFAGFDLLATGPRGADAAGNEETDAFVVRSGAHVDARARTLELADGLAARASGGTVESFSRVLLAPDHLRGASSVALRQETRDVTDAGLVGGLRIERGARIDVEARGGVQITGAGGVTVAGEIRAPGGVVTASLPTPAEAIDAGYLPGLGISFLATARVDVSGRVLRRPNDADLALGEVLAGGKVNVLAERGFIFADQGALFDLRGAAGAIDVPGAGTPGAGYQRRAIASAGGSLLLRAPESIDFAGTLRAQAGVGDTPAAGGSATIQLTRQRGFTPRSGASFPDTPRSILLVPDRDAFSPGANGTAVVDAGWLRASGVDALSLEAGNRIELYAGADLALGRSLQLAAPVVGLSGDALTLSAPHVSFGTVVDTTGTVSFASLPGTGALTLRGDLVELTGRTTLTGVGAATFAADRELRMRGFENAGASVGELRLAGDLTLRAPVIYPTTATSFTIVASGGAHDRVTFAGPAATDVVPYSVAGSLRVEARTIGQNTRVIAPFGRIDLVASENLALGAGSVTSVSADGKLLPFGRVQIGTDWVYDLGGRTLPVSGLPQPSVMLSGGDVVLDAGATVDLEGGGDLHAYEWQPGTGGSRDALAPGATPGLYAVLPDLRGGFAPYDPQESAGGDLVPGDTVYLSGIDGLPAGFYPLLPARYALLPGAFLVSAVAGTTDAAPGVATRLADGTPVVSGYRTFAGTGIRDARTTGFAVRPGSYARQLAGYQDARASTFDAARRPLAVDDAARLTLLAERSFDLRGRVLTQANAMGAGAAIDLAAPDLVLRAADAPAVAGAVNVDVSLLERWNAASLLLGGSRSGDGRTIDVVSDTLTFGAGARIAGTEIIGVANDAVRLDAGSSLSSNGDAAARAFAERAPLLLAGADSGAAIVGVSSARALYVERGAGTVTEGRIETDAGSRVASSGSLLLDGPGAVSLGGELYGQGATWALGSANVRFREHPAGADPALSGGLHLDDALLANLNQAARLRLSASREMSFGDPEAEPSGERRQLRVAVRDEIVLDTPSLGTGRDDLDVRFETRALTLRNSSASAASSAPRTQGTLLLAADGITIGPGTSGVHGFGSVTLAANGEVLGTGVARLLAPGDLTIVAGNVGAASDADLEISAAGTLRTARSAQPPDAARANAQLGGRIALSGGDLEHGGTVRVASGRIELAAANDLTLLEGSVLDASGVEVRAAGRTLGSGGGALLLEAGRDLDARAGALLAVSGAGDADAGLASLTAARDARLAAGFAGGGAAGARGGSFSGDFGTLEGFSALNAALGAGGFTERRSVRTRAGDLTLASGDSIVARDVSLRASGTLTVAGRIDASSGNQRGRIALSGDAGLALADSARLDARGAAGLGRGGSLMLESASGDVSAAAGSRIALGGNAEAGRLTVRAAATADGMRLGVFAADVSGVDVIALQPVLGFTLDPNPGAAEFGAIRADVTDFVALAAPALLARFSTSATPVAVRPGIELGTEGDLFLGSLDLSTWRFGGEAAALAFHATGAIDIDGTISDGFRRVGTGANQRIDLMADRSSTLSFESGDSIRLAAGARVRTGTGDLTFSARNDLEFGEGASVYTAGLAGEPTRELTRGASWALPTGGGRLELLAGGSVLGAPVTQAVGAWQVRQARPVFLPVSAPGWGTDLRAFAWNAGTLGGGDLVVRAGRDVRDLSAAAADSAGLANGVVTPFGGGVLEIEAGNDITSAFLHATRGVNLVRAGGELGRSRTDENGNVLGSLLSMQQASFDLDARRGIAIETVLNPTVLTQSQTGNAFRSYFFSFAEDSALRLRSATGDVELLGRADRVGSFLGNEGNQAGFNNDPVRLSVLPPNVELRATDGDVVFSGEPATMMPSDRSQLEIFARNDIRSEGSTLVMSDAPRDSLPTANAPADLVTFQQEFARHAASGRHADDDQPVRINAGRDIVGAYFLLSKFAQVAAGRDVRNLSFTSQNLRGGDATLITAGRDVIFDLSAGNRQFELGGPGRFDILAGRDVDLGFSAGISTFGRLLNPSLATERGADVTVFAGAGAGSGGALDVASFLAAIVAPSATHRAAFTQYVAGADGGAPASFDAALLKFATFAIDVQRAFVMPVFFAELVASGREFNTLPNGSFARGFAAIDALFAGSREPAAMPRYDGDIKLAFSRIYTLADADITLLAPGGLLNVGLANPPPGLSGTRRPSELGIVAQRAGSVRIFTNDDVLVNQSRIFTLRGGDITIWSTHGDIDAGRGAKSAISAPPPTILVDPSGRVTLDFSGAVAGSGIRGILTGEGIDPGDVDLMAPAGTIDAGDAGIGSAGLLNVAAKNVAGLGNFDAPLSLGVPPEVSNLGAMLGGAAAVAASASSAATDAATDSGVPKTGAPLAASAFGFIDVFLEGFGAEVCKPDDLECLKRNQQ